MSDKKKMNIGFDNPEVSIPEWIDAIKFRKPIKSKMNIASDARTINSNFVLAERGNITANIRELQLSLNDNQCKMYAMNKLHELLKGYRFTAEGSIKNDTVTFVANFVNNPMTYYFHFKQVNGKIENESFFHTVLGNQQFEYPYSRAGVEDSFEDAHNIEITDSIAVKSASIQCNIISRHDILQRCNNSVSEMKKLIKKLVDEDYIVPVGSNEYASVYDLQYLIPNKKAKFEGEANHTLEFVNNHVATASYECKTANRLAVEASKILNNNFVVESIKSANRDNNKLYMSAIIAHNGIRDLYHFNFSINNEKIGKLNYVEDDKNGERYSIAQIMNKFGADDAKIVEYLSGKNQHIAGGYVYSVRNIERELSKVMSIPSIKEMFNMWETKHLATKLNSTTYASPYNLRELVAKVQAKFLTKEKIAQIQQAQIIFGQNDKFYTYETKDNGTRTYIAVQAVKDNESHIENLVKQHFINCKIKMLNKHDFIIKFNNEDNKEMLAKYENDKIYCVLNGKQVPIEKVKKAFDKSDLLKQYIADGHSEKKQLSQATKIYITRQQFANKLKDYLSKEEIENVISDCLDNQLLISVGSDKYVSDYTFNDLIRNVAMFDSSIKQNNLKKADRTTYHVLLRQYITDNDTRSNVANETAKALEQEITKEVAKYFKNFVIKMYNNQVFNIDFTDKEGDAHSITAKIDDEGVIKCHVGNHEYTLDQINQLFSKSTLLKSYLVDNEREDRCASIIFNRNMLYRKLHNVIAKEEVDKLIDYWQNKKLITACGNNRYVSNYSMNELLQNCNDITPDTDLRANNLQKANVVADKKLKENYIEDNDTRKVENVITPSEFKQQFIQKLPKNIECTNFNFVHINDNQIEAEVELLNLDNGLTTTMKYDAYASDGNLPELDKDCFNDLFDVTNATQTYNKFQPIANNKTQQMIISATNLKKQLENYINVDNFNEVLKMLEGKHMITKVSSNNYAYTGTIQQLINNSNLQAYDGNEIAENYKKAKNNKNIIPKSYHIQDSDAKSLRNIKDGKSTEHIEMLKDKYINLLNMLESNHKITAFRKSLLMQKIETANDYTALSEAYKQIERYEK